MERGRREREESLKSWRGEKDHLESLERRRKSLRVRCNRKDMRFL